MSERLKALADAGVSIWLDDLSRERITSGNLADLVSNNSVSGVTTNPTIFAAALSQGHVLRRAGQGAGSTRRRAPRRHQGAHHRRRAQRVRHHRPRPTRQQTASMAASRSRSIRIWRTETEATTAQAN